LKRANSILVEVASEGKTGGGEGDAKAEMALSISEKDDRGSTWNSGFGGKQRKGHKGKGTLWGLLLSGGEGIIGGNLMRWEQPPCFDTW